MKAFTDTPITKEAFIGHIKWHQEMDKFETGHYGEEIKNKDAFTGCAVGCSLNSVRIELNDFSIDTSDHKLYEKYLGIPEWLARVEDSFFENLPEERKKTWPLEFSEAINAGSDLNEIKPEFLIYVLESNLERLQDKKFEEQRQAVENCINLWKRKDLYSSDWESEAESVESEAWSEAVSAARAAAWSAGSAGSAARSAAFDKFADKLIELIKKCK